MSKNAIDFLKLLQATENQQALKIVKVNTAIPLTFIFEGSPLALDDDIFEIPVSAYPLRKSDRFLAYPLINTAAANRWGLVQKLTGGLTLAAMQSESSLKIDGIDKVYQASDLILPQYIAVNNASSGGCLLAEDIRPLQAGDLVSIAPVLVNNTIKYAILNRY